MSIASVPQSIKRLLGWKVCPNEQQLVEYAEQQLIERERNIVEQHLTSCDACLKQVVFLMREAPIPHELAPATLLQTAMKIGTNRKRVAGRVWQWSTAAGVAAVTVVAIVAIERRASTPVAPEPSKSLVAALSPAAERPPATARSSANGDTLRGTQEASDSILISPAADERVEASRLEFRWQTKDGAEFYEIEILSEDGDVVWRGRTSGSALRVPLTVHLKKDQPYYVWIRIHSAHGTVEQSKAVRFTIG